MSTADPAPWILEDVDGVRVVHPMDEILIDPGRIERLQHGIGAMIEEGEPPRVVLSLEAVSHVSSLMLGVLISLQDQAQERGGDVHLAQLTTRVADLLSMTKLDRAFQIHPSTPEAIAAFGAKDGDASPQ